MEDTANDSSFSPLTDTTDIPYIDGQSDCPTNGVESRKDGTTDQEASKDLAAAPRNGGALQMCGRFSFPWLLTVSVVQLAIFLNKLYQDSAAVGKYFADSDFNFCVVSAGCLFVPALIYIIYIVSAYIKEQEDPEPKEVGTKVVHGLLLVPWQIKSRVEVLQFSAQRVCQTRKPTAKELEEKSLLDRQAAVLEFFAAFYAGLTQLLLQLYIIIVALDQKQPYKALTGEIIASGLTLVSMMAAVRRRDDGILTGSLAITGWMSIMVSRAVAIALAARVLFWWVLLICIGHALFVSFWVTSIAVGTYQESSLSKKRKAALFFLVLAVFGLPSLTYWPIMFELKKNRRPLLFLLLLLLENVLLVLLWAWLREDRTWYKHDVVLVAVTATCYVMGFLFVLLYVCCKPKYTDHVVYHDMKARNADSFGMYFEFCDTAFKLRRKEELETRLKEIREQKV